jgi:hypothetical protein
MGYMLNNYDAAIDDKMEELGAALKEKARLTAQENSVKADRAANRLRVQLAQNDIRILEEDMQYLLELKTVQSQVATKETV